MLQAVSFLKLFFLFLGGLWLPTSYFKKKKCWESKNDSSSLLCLLFLDLFPQSRKRKRRLSQSTTPKKKCKYVHSVQDQSQERMGAKATMKHKKASRPGQQRQPQRDTPQHRQGKKLSQQQRNTRQYRRPRNVKQKQPQAARQPRGKRQTGIRPLGSRWQGKSRLGQKQAFKGKSTFRKAGHSRKQKSA